MNSENCVIVNYPLPGNDVGGRVFVYGLHQPIVDSVSPNRSVIAANNRTCETPSTQRKLQQQTTTTIHVLFFCGGFPDHWTTFQPLAQRISATLNTPVIGERGRGERIVCGVTCLPGYDTHHHNFKKEGYTFDEMTVSLQSACKVLLTTITEHCSSRNTDHDNFIDIKLTGIFHDWGSYVGAMVVNRSNQLVANHYQKVVYFDVLPPAHPKLRIPREKLNIFKVLVLMSYTSLFALSHTIQRYVSFWFALPLVLIGYNTLFLSGLLPIRWLDNKTFLSDRPKEYTLQKVIYMQYPYYYLWRGFLSQGPKKFLKTTLSDATLPEDVSNASPNGTPVLYMYGTKKNAMFHDANTVAWLQHPNQHASLVVKVDGAGHWLYRQKEDICFEAICKFIGFS